MEYENLVRELKFSDEVTAQLIDLKDTARQFEKLTLVLTDMKTAEAGYKALDKALGGDEMKMLACQLWVAASGRSRWHEKGIPDEIFLNTMGCYRRFMGEALKKTGRLYFDRGWWTYRQLSMVIFRIGQLEYELKEEKKMISVHIPSDSVLEPEYVDLSVKLARDFFACYFPEAADWPMTCHSWLLSPELTPMLPENSRIRAFQTRFRLVEVEPEPMDVIEWLFAASDGTPLEQLREDTSLQRSVKKKLLNGGRIGVALGIMNDRI